MNFPVVLRLYGRMHCNIFPRYSALAFASIKSQCLQGGFPDTIQPKATPKDYFILSSTLVIGRSLTLDLLLSSAMYFLHYLFIRYVGIQEVSFPVVLMSKSCKLIVVMVGGVLILGKKYHLREYCCALAIIAGLFLSQWDSSKSGSSSFFGIGVLLLSLAFDSLNSNYNEKVVATNKHVLCYRTSIQLRLSAHSFADAM
jgi:drug/metabolite transporter (DMT)-like permease